MTNEEVAQACKKFHEYLAANGVGVKGYILHFNDAVAGIGNEDVILGALLCVVADMRGYKVIPK